MNSTAKRICLIVLLVLVTYGVKRVLVAKTVLPESLLPDWSFREMPYELGDWRGEDVKLDPVIAAATNADIIVDRSYQNDKGITITMHTAVFKDPAYAVNHTPINCYRGAGWLKRGDMQESLKLSDDLTIPVDLVVWEKGSEKILVLYWYQLGEHVLFDRLDLGKLRIAMRGRTKWPAAVKVMMQISAPDVDQARPRLLEFAEIVAQWENQPQHRKYFEEPPAS